MCSSIRKSLQLYAGCRLILLQLAAKTLKSSADFEHISSSSLALCFPPCAVSRAAWEGQDTIKSRLAPRKSETWSAYVAFLSQTYNDDWQSIIVIFVKSCSTRCIYFHLCNTCYVHWCMHAEKKCHLTLFRYTSIWIRVKINHIWEVVPGLLISMTSFSPWNVGFKQS